MTLKCGAQIISAPLATGGKVYHNSTIIAYNLTPIAGCTGSIWLYFKQQTGALNYPSPNMKVIITGTLSTPGTLNLVFLGGSLTRATDLTGRTNYQIRMGTTGLGFDWSDSASLNPVYNSATQILSYSVGISFHIDPSTVATSTSAQPTRYSHMEKVCGPAATRYWAFFSDGTNAVFASSTDGDTWSSTTSLGTGTNGQNIGVYCSGTTVKYVRVVGTVSLFYREGTFQSDGTISWSAAEQTITGNVNGQYYDGTLTVDTSSNLWTSAFNNNDGGCEVWTNSGGSWAQSIDLGTFAACKVLALTAGDMAALQQATIGSSAVGIRFYTGSWAAAINTVETDYSLQSSDACAQGDRVHFVVNDDGSTIEYQNILDTDSSWSSLVSVATDGANSVGIACSASVLSIVHIDSSNNVDWHMSTSATGASWTSGVAMASSESTPNQISVSYSVTSSEVLATWQAGSASPYNVRFENAVVVVTQPITITVDNSGTGGTATLSGCQLTDTSQSMDGVSESHSAAASCTITSTLPADATNTRHRTASDGSSYTIATCASGTCSSSSTTIYFQLRNLYQATPLAQTTWDELTDPTVVGTLRGTESSTLGTIDLVSGGGAASGQMWGDYNRAAVIGTATLGGAPANSRWNRNGACSFTQTTGGNTDNCDYYKQWTNTWQATPNAQTTWDSGLTHSGVTGTALGVASSTICTPTLTGGGGAATCNGYTDHNTETTVGTISGAPANSRWQRSGAGAFTETSGGNTRTVNYYKQWTNDFLYSLTGGGSPTAPTLTYNALGSSATLTLTTTAQSVYIDHSNTATSTNPLTGSTSSERWVSTDASESITAGGATVTFAYQRQYLLTNPNALSVTRTNNGTSATITGNGFVDAATSISVRATYTVSWTMSGARWIYDITAASIGIQVFADQAASGIQYINSDPTRPYVTFTTSSSATVQGFVPSQSNLVFSGVLNNGVTNSGATFSSNILTETGASPHEWDFTDPTQTPSNPSPPAEEETPITPGGGGGGPFVIQEEEPPATEEEPPSEDVRSTTGQGITAIILIVSIFVLVGLFLAGGGQSGMRQPSNKRAKPRRPSDTRPNMRRPKS